MNYCKIICAFSILIMTVFSSCKKEEDTVAPIITIDSPYEYKYYNVYDTVNIIGNVKDDYTVQAVSIKIVNSNFLPVLDENTFTPNAKEYNFNTSIALNDIHLTSGLYYILITATDGINSRNLFRAINIDAVPLKFNKIIAITNVNINNYNVYGVNDSLLTNLMFNYNGDYVSSAINNSYQQLYMCGSVNTNMAVYDLGSNSMQWSLPPENNAPFPSFNNVYFVNDILYVSYFNSKIIGYNRQGSINMTTHTTTGYTPGICYLHKDYLLTEERNTSGTDYFLSIYNLTGSFFAKNLTTIIIKGMEDKDDTHLYIFGNTTANKAVMTIYNIDFNGYYEPHAMPDATLNDYVKVDNNNYLLSIGNTVYWYQQITNSLTTVLSNVNAKRLKYESLSGNFIIAGGTQIGVYNFPSGNYVGGTTLPYTINDILLQYNR